MAAIPNHASIARFPFLFFFQKITPAYFFRSVSSPESGLPDYPWQGFLRHLANINYEFGG
jgi:hypothetical protein